MNFHSDSSAKRIAKNGVFTAIRFGVYSISGFLFIPFLLDQYGEGSYGLIALAGFLAQFVGLIPRCVGNAIARFLNVALNQNDWKQANEIYSTALVSKIGFIIALLPVFALGIWKLHWFFAFSPEIAQDFQILVACNVVVFCSSLLTGVFMTPILAANRLDISSALDAVRLGVRLILLYVLIVNFGAKLWLIGVVDAGLEIGYSMIIFFLRRRLAPDLAFKWKYVTRNWIRPVLNMAGWAMVTSLGSLAFVKTDIWMINRFVDAKVAGVYAALLIWPNFLKQVSKQLASILAPVYLIDYAKGDWQRVVNLSLSAAKLLGCFVALVVGVIYITAEPVLTLWWRGEGEVAQYIPLFRVMMFYLVYTIGAEVIWQIYITLNKVHFTGIVNLTAAVINITVSMVLIWMGYGAMGVAIGTVISLILASSFAIPLGACHEFKVSYNVIWWNYICATLVLLVAMVSAAAAVFVADVTVVGGIFTLFILLALGCGLLIKVILSAGERRLFLSGIKWLFDRGFIRNRKDRNPG